jgi:ABC-type glycerol-3-phosphate transport system permease component
MKTGHVQACPRQRRVLVLDSVVVQDLIAHSGHPLYDHPAMAAIAIAAIVIPLIVLAVVGRIFVRAAKEDRENETPAS